MASTSRDAQENIAQKTWEMENNVQMYSTLDDIYKYDKRMQQEILKAEPWKNDPLYFKEIKISALALLKMIMHARSSRTSEITGFLQGKVEKNTMIVIDTFAIPVEDTETKVNAQEQAYDYMIQYVQSAKVVGREESVIGWYHSHPGYGCWLSGVDVDTQLLNQNFQEPFVAIVIDPIRTISAGKVCLEAFRTYPINYKPANKIEYQTQVPLNKTKDFELHRKLYYSLNVSYFKSSSEYYLLNSLWNKYWVNTLSSCSLLTNAGYITTQINDVANKLKKANISLYKSRHVEPIEQLKGQNNLMKATQDSNTLTAETLSGFISQTVKEALFNSVHPRIFYNKKYTMH